MAVAIIYSEYDGGLNQSSSSRGVRTENVSRLQMCLEGGDIS